MAFQLFIVIKIMVLYCSVTCFLGICFILLIIVCKSHCFLSFISPTQLLPVYVWHLSDHIEQPYTAVKNIFHIFMSFIFSHLGKYILLTIMKQVIMKNV
jgi:hypothetical protein